MLLQSLKNVSRFHALRTLAAAAVLIAAARAHAQQPQIPPGAHGYEAYLIAQEFAAQQAKQKTAAPPAPRFVSAPPAARAAIITVTLAAPRQAFPTYVYLQGPDGVVRRFELEVGRDAVSAQPGAPATVNPTASAPK